ncbi:membrane dipeptidase [Paenibacillus qinlingensis]|uniref:Membrane dipeptidase n=1 Tax=Paenibacillus qinlingensis TaxID=1837343 RepID=A0ABU1P3S9_9BACL|nr:membrane dipeptidase [Paenibacillus qinlingensis]MDR6554209.1 membrane dipeptidase [Paenibacillus qinlingensis]
MNSTEGLYPFNLTPEEEERARELHESSIIIDLLFQGPLSPKAIPEAISESIREACEPFKEDSWVYSAMPSKIIHDMAARGEISEFKDEWYRSGITAGNRQLDVSSVDKILISMGDIQRQFDANDWLVKAVTAEQIRAAKANGLKAGIVTAQETDGLGKNLELLEAMYNFGLRVLQLTYNNQNYIASGCMEEANGGVSKFGMRFIAKMNELGIIVDTSHCGKQTTLDACRLSTAPVIASHTGVENIYPHKRCKSDEEFQAIAATGGVIGVFAMPWFVHGDPNDTTIDHVLDHMDYLVRLVGVDHVGIGTDWPMSDVAWSLVYFKEHIAPRIGFAKGDGPSTETVKGLEKYSYFINFTRGLVARGYSDEDVRKMMGGNWLRVFEAVCG